MTISCFLNTCRIAMAVPFLAGREDWSTDTTSALTLGTRTIRRWEV